MPGKLIKISLYIPDAVYDALPAATKTAFRDRIREMKAKAVKVNEGLPNEEATVTATIHEHRHDIGQECDPEVNI